MMKSIPQKSFSTSIRRWTNLLGARFVHNSEDIEEAAKRIARENLKTDLGALRHWWTEKYRLPPTSDEFLDYTIEDLYVEYFEDYILRVERDPKGFEERKIGGATYFRTGDPLVDKWESQLERGIIPDFEEGLTEEQKKKWRTMSNKLTTANRTIGNAG